MSDSTALPSRRLKALAQTAKWLLWLVLAAWALFALGAVALHGFIVPRIDDFRPGIEQRVGKALGVPLSIGKITAQSTGLFPSVELQDVALLDAAGRPALRLARVIATVSPASIWRAGFEQLYVGQPDLELRRDAEGKLHVGGLALNDAGGPDGDGRAADWLFSQPELMIEGGRLRLVDELAQAPPLLLEDIRLALRNKGLAHEARIEATPPQDWGRRFTLQAKMREPLLALHSGRWRDWSGQLHADVPALDLARLQPWAGPDLQLERASAALRLWADVKRAQLEAVTVDTTLADVHTRFAKDLPPLNLSKLNGRIEWRRMDDGFDLAALRLRIVSGAGLAWPGSELHVRHQGADPQRPQRGQFSADKLDLALLDQWSRSLPLERDVRTTLARLSPKGLIEDLDTSWQGAPDSLQKYRARGRASGLELTAQPVVIAPGAPRRRVEAGVPGVRGASLEFDLDQAAGKATLAIDNGTLTFPGVFEDPVIAIDQMSGTVNWQSKAAQLQVAVTQLKFANADAAGQAQAMWRTSDPAQSQSKSRFPGVLELSGNLDRANGTRVHRYLPLELPQDVRHHVRDAVLAGGANLVKFTVKGDLDDMPFADPKRGEFRVTANVRDATYAFVPPGVQPAGEPAWPALTQLSGELVFERASMRVNGARGQFGNAPGLPVKTASVLIPNLDRAVVQVDAELNAPLAAMLQTVNTSPVGKMIDGALARASGSGDVGLRLKLELPIANLDQSKVQGSVVLAGNDVRITPDSPLLARANGVVSFTESGFSVDAATAQIFGGEARIDGSSSMRSGAVAPDALLAEFRAQGGLSAEGLRAATDLGVVAQLAKNFSGSTRYDAKLSVRRSGPELTVTSDLQGLASRLPEPLAKAADTVLPFRLENAPLAAAPGRDAQDRLALSIGEIASATYLRDVSGPQARALRGSLTLGVPASAALPTPSRGVAARIELAQLDADAWGALNSQAGANPPSGKVADAGTAALRSYWPTQWQSRIGRLDVEGYRLANVVLKGSRDAGEWRSDVATDELNGRLEYREGEGADPGRISARLARLVVPDPAPAAATLAPQKPAQQLPALDIVVDDFELRGRKLGRVEVDAVNRSIDSAARGDAAREWRLNKLDVRTPDARFSANGSWAQAGPRGGTAALKTTMDFELEIADSGALLARFGMKDVIRRGRGVMQGRLAWDGSPLALDFPTLGGKFHLSVESGQFLKADPGLAKLLGVLSLQALPRRLSLDFRDVFSDGFAFDFIRGDVNVTQGVASTNNLQMKGATAAVLMDGSADIARETQNLKVVVVPQIDAGTAALVATVINPAIGLGTFLAQYFLSKPLSQAATQEFRVQGTWNDPQIARIPRRPADGADPQGGPAISIGPVQ